VPRPRPEAERLMIFRWILFAVIALLARRLVLSWMGRGKRDRDRVGSRRPREQSDARERREKDLAAGQRIEEAEYEELD
jgi:hypothetical protein